MSKRMVSRLGRGALLTLSVCAWMAAKSAFAETYLIKDGKPQADIVIADKPPRMVKLAAEELQAYIEKISGAKLAITNAPGTNVPAHIYVGRSAETDKLKITDEGLKHGAFKMVSGENWLALVGHDSDYTPPRYWSGGSLASAGFLAYLKLWDADMETWAQGKGVKLEGEKWSSPYIYQTCWREYSSKMGIWEKDERGSLNAVYAFLRDLGIRWYLPGELGEIVPKKTSIALPSVDKTVLPDFALRYFWQYGKEFYCNQRDEILWQLRLGLNEDRVGNCGGLCHGIGLVIGREETKQAHPEFYKQWNGKRIPDKDHPGGEPCLSSPGLLASNVKFVRAMFDFCNEEMISVMMPDGMGSMCQCELCKGKETLDRGNHGAWSDYIWDYVNRVAQEVYKTNPDKTISSDIYGGCKLPPTKIDQFSPNIVFGLCQSRMYEFNDILPKAKEETIRLRQEWLKKIPKGHTPFFVYGYYLYGGFSPTYFPHAIAADLRSLKGLSLGEFIEIRRERKTDVEPAMGVTHLNLYVTAQFLWDAEQDLDKLLGEYYTLFYGPAAAEMKAFIEYSEANWPNMEKNADKIDQVMALLGKAQEKVAPESVYAKRIKLIADHVGPLKDFQKQIAKGRGPVPEAQIRDCDTQAAKALKLDGKLDDAFWQGIESYELKEVATGRQAACPTSFKMGYANDSLYIGIECKGSSKEALANTTTQRDNQAIFMAEDVEIMLETQTHSYYHLAISPGGGLIDSKFENGGFETLWSSNAEIATHVDGDSWSIEIRIPVFPPTQEDSQPMLGVAGNKPTENSPWYFNVCRQVFGEKKQEFSAFSPTGAGFQVPLKFGKLYVR